MGNCCNSCFKGEDENEGEDSTERQQLLRDPVINATQVVNVPQSSDPKSVAVAEGMPAKGQEDELAKILQETASAMIDVSGSGSHSLDQREFQERSRHYLSMIQTLSPSIIRNPTSLLLGDHPNPEKQLGSGLISKEDLDLMGWAMSEVEEALSSFRVHHDEDLVVPFGGGQMMLSSPTSSS